MIKYFVILGLILSQQPVFANQVTWYNQHGKMANGKRFNPKALTAAHRTAKLGSKKTLCHKGRCVRVTITDRCKCNSYDLTPTAFRKLNPSLKKGRLHNVRAY